MYNIEAFQASKYIHFYLPNCQSTRAVRDFLEALDRSKEKHSYYFRSGLKNQGSSKCVKIFFIYLPGGNSKINNKHLITLFIHKISYSAFHTNFFNFIQITQEHRKLQMIAIVLHDFEYLFKALLICNIIRNQVSPSHRVSIPG